MLRNSYQVVLRFAGEDQIGVGSGVVVDQVVQLGTLVHVTGDRVLDDDAVDGDRDAVVVFDFHAGGVDIVFAGYSFGHVFPPFSVLLILGNCIVAGYTAIVECASSFLSIH